MFGYFIQSYFTLSWLWVNESLFSLTLIGLTFICSQLIRTQGLGVFSTSSGSPVMLSLQLECFSGYSNIYSHPYEE